MANVHMMRQAGGTLEKQADSVVKVSFWHIPGGTDYDQARVIEGYFNDIKAAIGFQEKYETPPEMAALVYM